MDIQLVRMKLVTEQPEVLKTLMSEVIGAEVLAGEGLYEIVLGDLSISIVRGASPAQQFVLSVSKEIFQEMLSRWEFFCFRFGETCQLQRQSENEFFFLLSDGTKWRVMQLPVSISG